MSGDEGWSCINIKTTVVEGRSYCVPRLFCGRELDLGVHIGPFGDQAVLQAHCSTRGASPCSPFTVGEALVFVVILNAVHVYQQQLTGLSPLAGIPLDCVSSLGPLLGRRHQVPGMGSFGCQK